LRLSAVASPEAGPATADAARDKIAAAKNSLFTKTL
jgi:hypothetical protein